MLRAIYPDLANKLALVTGGSSGIGAAISAALLLQGARVVVLDLLEPDADLAGANYLRCDLRDASAVASAIANATREWGDFDILVNTAACDDRHTLEEADSARTRPTISDGAGQLTIKKSPATGCALPAIVITAICTAAAPPLPSAS